MSAKSIASRLAPLAVLGAVLCGATAAQATPVQGTPFPRFCTMIAGVVYHPVTGAMVSFTNGCQLNDLLKLGFTMDPPAPVQTVTGTLEFVFAIGGETTGTALLTEEGSLVEVDLDTNGFTNTIAEGERVAVEGHFEDVAGVEIPTRKVFVVTRVVR